MMKNLNAESAKYFTEINREMLFGWVANVELQVSDIFTDMGNEITKKMKSSLLSISHYNSEIKKEVENESVDRHKLFELGNTIVSRANQMMAHLREVPTESQIFQSLSILNRLIQEGRQTLISENIEYSSSVSNHENIDLKKITSAIEILKSQLAVIQNDTNKSRQLVLKTQKKAEQTDLNISTYDQRLSDTLQNSSKTANNILEELLTKQNEVNDLVGIITATTLSGTHAKSADGEKRLADAMRNGSVLLMLAIVLIIGYSLFETGQPHFDWETGLFRLLFSLALSVPAAYLARESSKHREQQYSYQSVSLDLQAITPYLASLPTEEQHRLKAEVANRIFGVKESTRSQIDSYPLNLNELILALLQKNESAGKNDEK